MEEALWITLAFGLGLGFRYLGLPPLVGYLVAGFAGNGIATALDYPLHSRETMAHIAHLGVLLLLFTVGLKLRLQNLLRPEVWGGGTLHLVITVGFIGLPLTLGLGKAWPDAWILAAALAFSSTVVAAKVLEAKRELRAFHGRVAIGILIIQDLAALALLSTAGGHVPSLWALLVLALPLFSPLFNRLLDASGHDELLVLLGLLLAIAVGGFGFESVGLSAELGALLLGAVLANHSRASELSHALWSIKEIFLVGFFLQIGMSGLPGWETLLLSGLFLLLLPLKAILFFFILVAFNLRARSAFLCALSLASYSEFGLIVSNLLLPDWTVTLAITVALSFVIAAPLNRIAHSLYERFEYRLSRFQSDKRHPDEQPVSLGMAHILIMGMGRTGTAAYDFLRGRNELLVGLDSDPGKVSRHLSEHRRVLYADAEDPGFWHDLKLEQIRAVILSMNDIESKLITARQLRARGFAGRIVALCQYDDEAEKVLAAGADLTFGASAEMGVGLAEHVWLDLYGKDPQPVASSTD